MYLTFHLLHAGLLCLIVFSPEATEAGGLSPTISAGEIIFWGWTLLFFVAELKEFKDFTVSASQQ